MTDTIAKIRVNSSSGDIEIDGSEQFVREMWREISDKLPKLKPPSAPKIEDQEAPPGQDVTTELQKFARSKKPKNDKDKTMLVIKWATRDDPNKDVTLDEIKNLLPEAGYRVPKNFGPMFGPMHKAKLLESGLHRKSHRLTDKGSDHVDKL